MSTEWFDGNTNPRYIIWFFRDPNINCQWKYHGRYSTNEYRDVRSSLQQTMLRLLAASSICTAGETQTTVKAAVTDRVIITTTRAIATTNRVTTTASFQSTRLPNDNRCPIVIDVRTQLEWDEGHATCAHRLEIQNDPTLVDKVLELANGNPSYPLQLYCRSGNRSGQAVKILQELGWTHVTNAGGWHSGEIDAIKKLCDCTAVEAVCPKCGTNKKSGKLTCCGRGGSWFKKCGDTDDPKFDHTWDEGVEACAGKLCYGFTDLGVYVPRN